MSVSTGNGAASFIVTSCNVAIVNGFCPGLHRGRVTGDSPPSVSGHSGGTLASSTFPQSLAGILQALPLSNDRGGRISFDGPSWVHSGTDSGASSIQATPRTSLVGRGSGKDDTFTSGFAGHKNNSRGTYTGLQLKSSANGSSHGAMLLQWLTFLGARGGNAFRAYLVYGTKTPFDGAAPSQRYVHVQSVGHTQTLQDGGTEYSPSTAPSFGLDDGYRSEGSVPNYGYSPSLQRLLYLSFPRKILSLFGRCFWYLLATSRVHKTASASHRITAKFWRSPLYFFGRHSGNELIVCPVLAGHTGRPRSPDASRVCNLAQGAGKIGPSAEGGVERRTYLQPNHAVLTAAREGTQRQEKADEAKARRNKGQAIFSKTVGIRVRTHAVDAICNTSSVPLVAGSAPLRNKVRNNQQEMLGPDLTGTSTGGVTESGRFRSILTGRKRKADKADASSVAKRHRRLGVRWRDSDPQLTNTSNSSVALDPAGSTASYKLEGASNSSNRTGSPRLGAPRSDTEPVHIKQNGQHRLHVVRKSTGRTSPEVKLSGGSAVVLSSGQRLFHPGSVSSRKTKRRSRHRQPVVDRRQRVQINSRNISETKQSVGPVHDRRFRVSSQQADSNLLVPPRGSRNSRPGRIPSGLEAPENLGLPPVSADSTSAKSGSRPANNSSNNSTLLDQSVLVPPAAGNVPGLENPGPSSIGVPSSSTPGKILSVSAEDQARLFMEYGSVQNMRQHLQQQGFSSAYIDRILRRWEDPEVKTTISQHKHMWDTLFVPWCVKQTHNPFEYNVPAVANFLADIQKEAENAQGVAKNHAKFKKARAAVVDILSLFHPTMPSLAETHEIKRFAAELRVSAPHTPKYSVAVKLDPIFAMYIADFEKGLRFVSMKLKDLRSRAMFLLRVKTFGRSADMSVINRIFTTDPDSDVAGIIGNRALDVIEQVRYDFPKTWATIGRFSTFKSLGPYLKENEHFQEKYGLCCVRSAVEIYFNRTKELDIASLVNCSRPGESVKRLFVSVQKKNGKFIPISKSTVASCIKQTLKDAGIDTKKFQAHIVRASSMKTAIGGGHPEDAVLTTAQISKGVFAGHYNLPLVDGTVSGLDTDASATMLGAAAIECLLENSVSASSASEPITLSSASAPVTIENTEQALLTQASNS